MSIESKIGMRVKLSIQIVNFRSRRYLKRCLFSIAENLPVGVETEILLVNNDKEPLGEIVQDLKSKINFHIQEVGKNIGFGKAHNTGLSLSQGDIVLFLNPDTIISHGALQMLLSVFIDQQIGIAGPLLVDATGRIQSDCFGVKRTPLSIVGKKIFWRNVSPTIAGEEIFATDWISGGAMMVRRDVFEGINGFDENFFMYFEDMDLCLRAKKFGYKIAINPKARIFHESGKSFASEQEKKKHYYASQDYYVRKHFGRMASVFVKLMRFPYYVKNVWLNR